MTSSSENTILNPAGDLTIRTVGPLHSELQALLRSGRDITIRIPEQHTADLSFVQLVEAARLSAQRSGQVIALAEPAAGSLLDVLERGGVIEGMSAGDRQFWLHQGEIH